MDEKGNLDFEDLADHYHKYAEIPDTKHNNITNKKLTDWIQNFQQYKSAITGNTIPWTTEKFFVNLKFKLLKKYRKRQGWD